MKLIYVDLCFIMRETPNGEQARSDEAFSLAGHDVTHTSSSKCKSPEQALSAETFFSYHNVTSTAFDKF